MFAFLAPAILNTYWISTLLTQVLIFGICAASLIFLSAYGGMVSLAQLAIYGIAGFALGNFTTNGNTKGLNLGWAIGPGIVVAIAIAVLFAVIFGVLANRSYGIYFLMITLVFSVIANLVFGQVTNISGFGGISGIRAPGWINAQAHPSRMYFVTLVIALALLVMLRYVARTPFGLALQGIRDDPAADALAGLQRRAAPHGGVRARRVRRGGRRHPLRLVERADLAFGDRAAVHDQHPRDRRDRRSVPASRRPCSARSCSWCSTTTRTTSASSGRASTR